VPVLLETSADVEGLGEVILGAARGLRHALYVHAGWDIGVAVVLDGRLRRGTSSDFTHVSVPAAHGAMCRCGRRNCLASIASGWAVLDALAVAHGSHLDLAALQALALRGDPATRRALTDAGDALGAVMAGLCSGLNPEAVVIGGELGFPGSPLIDAARERVARDVNPGAAGVIVVPAALGHLGAALGAAMLVVRSRDVFADRVASH
jgi:predicted NBD/HSP70 family sugar kinase